MAQATITARVDDRDKAAFDAFCSNVGLNTSTAINLFVKAVLREHRILFEISQPTDPFYSDPNQTYLMKSVQEPRAVIFKANLAAVSMKKTIWFIIGRTDRFILRNARDTIMAIEYIRQDAKQSASWRISISYFN